MARFYFLTLINLFSFYFNLQAQSEPDYYTLAMDAYAKKDYKNYLSNLQVLDKAGAHHPYLVHLYAGAYALNNMPEETLKQLNRLGEMGLFYSLTEHPDFKSFVTTEQFKQYKKKYGHLNAVINNSTPGFVIPEKDLIPEGIAYDPKDSVFYVGSLYKNKIVSVDASGKVEDFKASGEDGLLPVLGMKVDPKKRILWVCSSAGTVKPNELRESGVFKFNLDSKKLIRKYMVSKEGEDHFLNDLVIAPSGDVYISDSHGGTVFTIPAITDEIVEMKLSKQFGYPNGIAISPDGKYLFLASFHDGITRINLKDNSLHTLTTPAKTTLLGIDGLYYINNSLIVVQNGIEPQRIVKFDLSPDYSSVTKATILESNNPLFEILTTGVVVNEHFYYIANSHLRNLEKGKIINHENLRDVQVLKVRY